MADDGNFLDDFLSPDKAETEEKQEAGLNEQANKGQESTELNLEDEFTKLLRDFINQDTVTEETSDNKEYNQEETVQTLDAFETTDNAEDGESGGLEGFVTENNEESLDSFADNTTNNQQSDGLDGFVTVENNEAGGLDSFVPSNDENITGNNSLDEMVSDTSNSDDEKDGLKSEEQELARAVSNFQDGVNAMASNKNLRMPKTDYTEDMLKPNYKPSVGKKIAQYLLNCWDIINRYDPENMKKLSPNATDEEYLAFAESVSDVYLQLSIISYVEILINIEICEVSYEQKKELALKNRIKRELYEEYVELQERKNTFIRKLKEKNFPIDADKLINNYFRAAQKDADGAFEALTKNPAMFSRIEIEKMRPKFFGLIKVTPEDGIKMNQKIGKFIKNLKA